MPSFNIHYAITFVVMLVLLCAPLLVYYIGTAWWKRSDDGKAFLKFEKELRDELQLNEDYLNQLISEVAEGVTAKAADYIHEPLRLCGPLPRKLTLSDREAQAKAIAMTVAYIRHCDSELTKKEALKKFLKTTAYVAQGVALVGIFVFLSWR